MSEALLEPRREFAIAGRSFDLLGNFQTLKDIQQAFKEDIIRVQNRVMDMRLDEITTLLTLSARSTDAKAKEHEIGAFLIEEVDISSTSYTILKYELMCWLALAMTPRAEREKKARNLMEAIDKARERIFPGRITSKSASEPSNGTEPPSGPATFGK